MRIAYVASHGNTGTDDTEGHIAHSLRKLGHEVTEIHQRGSPAGVKGHDLLLFHHWYDLHDGFFDSLKMPKVGWYFDKAWNGREKWLQKIIPRCTAFFMTDGSWAAQSGFANLHVLRQGIGDRDTRPGTHRPDLYPYCIGFTGSLYGERIPWADRLRQRYGYGFKVVTGVHNRDLYDFSATVPIIVAPPFPSDDGYWSNRIYLVLGSGGFMVHPRLAGLAAEFDEGVHYAAYGDQDELEWTIDYYLKHPDEARDIAKAGQSRMLDRFTFTHRCRELLKATAEHRNTGTKE